jgi:hypothetical protein
VLEALARLHEPKDRIYRDAWRKRGELVGVFANIARKYDRLEQALGEENPDAVESVADTIADLCLYAVKYLTYLAEVEPEAFRASSPPLASVETLRADQGHGAVVAALGTLELYEEAMRRVPPRSLAESVERVRGSFAALEELLLGQVTGGANERAAASWMLADDAARLLWRFSLDQPARYERFVAAVSALSDSDL